MSPQAFLSRDLNDNPTLSGAALCKQHKFPRLPGEYVLGSSFSLIHFLRILLYVMYCNDYPYIMPYKVLHRNEWRACVLGTAYIAETPSI